MSSLRALAKHELRGKLRAVLKARRLDTAESSRQACNLLRQQAVWKEARAVLIYAALAGELDLAAMLEEGLRDGKNMALPRFQAETGVYDVFQVRDLIRDCAPGKFGISEPKPECARFPLNRLDLVLAPGLGFDAAGHRLGRGQGFYDRLLAQISGIKCGVAFDQQIVERIPAEEHDVRMNYVLTPTRWLEIAG